MVYDKLPGEVPHGWKFIKVGPDGKLYVPIGAPCNICEAGQRLRQDHAHEPRRQRRRGRRAGRAQHRRLRLRSEERRALATNNGRDWLSEDLPNDSLQPRHEEGQHFGFPYCHQGNFADPSSAGAGLQAVRAPALLTGRTPARWACASTPAGFRRSTRARSSSRATARGTARRSTRPTWSSPGPTARVASRKMEPFLTGLVENNEYLGRPVDVLVLEGRLAARQRRPQRRHHRISYAGK